MATTAIRRALSGCPGVVDAFYALYSDQQNVVWLDRLGDRGNNTSVLATGHLVTLTPGNELASLRDFVASQSLTISEPGVPLGFIGVLAYDIAQETLGIEGVAGARDTATSRGVWVERALEFNADTGEVIAWGVEGDAGFNEWVEGVHHALEQAPTAPPPKVPTNSVATWRDQPDHYRDLIRRAQGAIKDGEVYQICLTTSVHVDSDITDVDLHTLLRDLSPTHHQGLLRLGDYSLVSASPETFLSLEADRTLRTRPIKGTRPRGAHDEADQALISELVESAKEQAENLMIVDLMRNDLQKVCETGSVSVTGLFEVETYSSVHQLVSTVEGTLREGADGVDALAACFPAGSMTGAPKHRAVSLLAQWESAPRGVYSGCWGWWRLDGSMEWAMTIRSAVFSENGIEIGVGGGITWSSDVDQEIKEVGHKAKRMLEALGIASIQYS